ncbi:peptide chain release factor N(5)-glutamine methyltransferase [Nitratireductor kimnyeongensis]|uniref:Release factor glutamine methyltransferase n=1 Tax=Nitratireductor kimnyeongensis TaxID=430679 RepID=A0ABW0TBT4_9HYPH|nr:peptide chain release factor N(5)-glutamine methyltransferase [Nitratireductor kimnyeongensis]QZZ36467.1 peptide chain release factor N(5)-glutamine methyltransferase [Nitratireductor kimnyeongensis]
MADAETLGALLSWARSKLANAGIPEAALDARLLVEHVTQTTRLDAISRPERPVGAEERDLAQRFIDQRIAGKPVHRILGFREFYGLKFNLSDQTLEPRPDTETLVQLVLDEVRRVGGEGRPWRILDLGTGTGAIALALLSVLPEARAIGADISADALATAHANADMHGYGYRFEARLSDWFGNIDGRYDIIVSNPPYIREDDWRDLAIEVREHDPRRALVAGQDGLDAYRRLAAESSPFLSPGGIVAVEIGYNQKESVVGLFTEHGFRLKAHGQDLAGHDRVLVFAQETPREQG